MGGMRILGGLAKGFGAGWQMRKAEEKEKEAEQQRKDVEDLKRRLEQKLPGEGGRGIALRKGGRVKKTGIYRLHKGEIVIPEKMAGRLGKRKSQRKASRR